MIDFFAGVLCERCTMFVADVAFNWFLLLRVIDIVDFLHIKSMVFGGYVLCSCAHAGGRAIAEIKLCLFEGYKFKDDYIFLFRNFKWKCEKSDENRMPERGRKRQRERTTLNLVPNGASYDMLAFTPFTAMYIRYYRIFNLQLIR